MSPRQSAYRDRKPSAHPRRFTRLCAGSAFGIALLAEAGWLFHARFLAGQLGGCIPMSPTTALALLLLSGGVFCHERWSEHGRSRRLALVLACVPALLGLLVLAQFFAGFDSGLEWALSRTNEVLGRVRIGRMSPWSAGTFLLESAALMLVLQASRRRFATSVAALLALLATAGSLVVSVGYAYGVPLLSGGTTIPMSLPTALAFVLLGAGEISLAVRALPTLGGWSGDSTRGMLIRAFLPTMLFFILVEDWVQTRTAASLNPALLHSLTALACCALIVAISFWTARRTGDAIDRAEQALRESESQYRELFESSSDAIFLIDTATDRIVEANDMATMLYGYNHDELLAKKGTDLSAEPEDTRQHIQAARRAPGEVFRIPLRLYRKKDGTVFPVEITTRSFVSREKVLLLVSARDITERKRAEETLRNSEMRLRAALDATPFPIALVDVQGSNIDFWSRSALTLFGHTAPTGAEWFQIAHPDPDYRRQVIDRWEAALEKARLSAQAVNTGEYRITCRDGSVRVCELYAAFLADRLIVTFDDITDRQRAEEERGALQAQLAETRKMESVGRLAGGVAHDFNNLLTVINGYAAFLAKQLAVRDPLRAYAMEIAKAGGHAASLTSQLLAFGRKQMIRPRATDMNGVVADAEGMLRRLIREDVELVARLTPHLGLVMADPDQIRQVILNLAINARDAMPNGGRLEIATARVEMDQTDTVTCPGAAPGRYVQLTFSDTGMGMTEEVRRNIFEPFFTTKAQGKGTGLGLSMVDGIVKQSGGFIEVDSEPGRGTTFRIYLPSVEDAPSPSGKPAAVPAMRGNETILVVEDQAEVREYAAVALGAYGYRVIEAASAEEALLRCERERGCINLVLTDVVMPNISGRELADRLEKLQPGMKVLFMSGYAAGIIARHGVPEKGMELIEKPFLPEQLAIKVREVLGGGGADQATVLVAEDSAPVRKLLAEILREAGYAVVEACDGVETLERLAEGHVQLALMDAGMPRQGGFDAARETRRQFPEVKIILMSAAFDGVDAWDPVALGVDGLLSKPMAPKVLLDTVQGLLASRRLG